VLCNIDEENEGYTYAFQWLNVYRNGLDTFGENLVLDDVMTEDEITEAKTRARCSRIIDELRSSIDDVDIDK
jgi:hypothetical protein